MNYGVPYMGSKNSIARQIVDCLPPAEYFVDLFAGGCAVTHAAMLSNGKYKKFIANDIDWRGVTLFRDAIAGKYRDEKRVITREMFQELKDTDAYVALCWSFGNNGEGYLWNDDTAGFKIIACKLIYADTYQERLELYRQLVKYWQSKCDELQERKEKKGINDEEIADIKEFLRNELIRHLELNNVTRADVNKHTKTVMARHYFSVSQWSFPAREEYNKMREIVPTLPEYDYWGQDLQRLQSLQRLQGMESLQSLQRLQELQSLERLQELHSMQGLQRLQSMESLQSNCNLNISISSYDEVSIPKDACIYCDIPYKGTAEYSTTFDHEAFYNWVRNQSRPIYISEYAMPKDFKVIWANKKCVLLSSTGNSKKAIEKLFVHESQFDKVHKTDLFGFEDL